jgi:hypothetical protein
MRKFFVSNFIILILLSGCGVLKTNSQTTEIVLETETIPTESIQVLETAMPPTQEKLYSILYLSSGNKIQAIDEALRFSLDLFEDNYGIEWNEIEDITNSNVASLATRILFTYEDSSLFSEIILRYPQMTIVYLNQIEQNPGKSTSIGLAGDSAESTAFVSGYLAGIFSYEWRIAGISTNSEQLQLESFVNGVKYYCGLCNPLAPPFVEYPLVQIINDLTDNITVQGFIQDFRNNGVDIIYLSPSLVNQETLSVAKELGISIVLNVEYQDVNSTSIIGISGSDWEGEFKSILETIFQNLPPENYYSPLQVSFLSGDVSSPGKTIFIDEALFLISIGDINPNP